MVYHRKRNVLATRPAFSVDIVRPVLRYRYSNEARQETFVPVRVSIVFAHLWYVSVQKAQREELYTAIAKAHSIFNEDEERTSLLSKLQASLCHYPKMFTSSCSGSCPGFEPCGRRC